MKVTSRSIGEQLHVRVEGRLDSLLISDETWEAVRSRLEELATLHPRAESFVDIREVSYADSRSIYHLLSSVRVLGSAGTDGEATISFLGPGAGLARLQQLGEAPFVAPTA